MNLLERYDKLSLDKRELVGRMILAFAIQQDLMRAKLPMLFPGTPLSEHCDKFIDAAQGIPTFHDEADQREVLDGKDYCGAISDCTCGKLGCPGRSPEDERRELEARREDQAYDDHVSRESEPA